MISVLNSFSFADGIDKVPGDLIFHSFGNQANTLVQHRVMVVDQANKFNPDMAMTKRQMVALLANLLKSDDLKLSNNWRTNLNQSTQSIVFKTAQESTNWAIGNNNDQLAEDENSVLQINLMTLLNAEVLSSNSMGEIDNSPVDSNFVIARIFDFLVANQKYQYVALKAGLSEQLSDISTVQFYTIAAKAKYLVDKGIISSNLLQKISTKKNPTRGQVAAVFTDFLACDLVDFGGGLPQTRLIEGPYISQLNPVYAPVGCEATSLLMGLKAKGYADEIELRSFLDAMPKTQFNPAKGFVGSPYVADLKKKTRTTIFPDVLAKFASAYGDVRDVSGIDENQLKALVLQGKPVVVYMTLYYEKPFYRWYTIEGGEQKYWLSNNHVVLVAGYDKATDRYYIRDPYNHENTKQKLEYWIEASKFDWIYNERRHAIAVY